jgi:DNA-binding beta-propeller fold protein YncE
MNMLKHSLNLSSTRPWRRLHLWSSVAGACLLLVLLLQGGLTANPGVAAHAAPASPTKKATAASDTFQRTVNSGWGSADKGGWWSVVGSPWNWSVSPGAGKVIVQANSEERAYLSTFNIQDVNIREKVVLPLCGSGVNCDSYVLGRYSPAYDPTYYRIGVIEGGSSDIYIRAQRSDGTNLSNDLDTGLPASNNVTVWLHVQFLGTNPTTIRARAWLPGTPEPSTWLLNTTDNNPAEQTAGMIGVRERNEDPNSSHTFKVESYTAKGTATPVSIAPNPTGKTKTHWLYVVVDGEVSVYDIDNNFALVQQFSIPEAGKRGTAVAPKQGILYISECGMNNCGGTSGSLIAYDLRRQVVKWIANYSFGVDQLAITPDGKTIYMPHGEDSTDGTTSILDAHDGQPTGSIYTGTNGHDTVVSLDGTQAYLTGYTGSNYNYAHVIDTSTQKDILDAGPVVNGIRPFTVNGIHTIMYTTSTYTCGFQVLSLTTGQVLYTIPFSGSCNWPASNAPSHGISLSPDEQRLYVMDAPLDQLEVYDVSQVPQKAPVFVGSVQLSSLSGNESPCQTWCEREGWVLNDLSGSYVFVGDTGDIVNTSTLKVETNLAPLQNTREMVEIDWKSGSPSATSTHFGLGHVLN